MKTLLMVFYLYLLYLHQSNRGPNVLAEYEEIEPKIFLFIKTLSLFKNPAAYIMF